MKSWTNRPREEAYLFNPAFCCVIITTSCISYDKFCDSSLPFPLAFMVLPIVLHKRTRDMLPSTIKTSMPAWLQENPSARLLFHERLMSLRPHTREAINYGLLFNWLALGDNGGLLPVASNNLINHALRLHENEARDCVLHAKFLGKWLASVGSTATSMALWGVRP